MGNKPSSSNNAKDSTKIDFIINFTIKVTVDEYRQKIDHSRQLYNNVEVSDEKHNHEVEFEYFKQYDELVDCLSLNHAKIGSFYRGNSQIGIISQLIQQYSGNYYMRLVYTINRQDPILSKYDIRHISSITNPVTSDIYITDTVSIYKIPLFATSNDNIINHSKQQVCKIYSMVDSKSKHKNIHNNIFNLAINSCGQGLFFQCSNFCHIPISSQVDTQHQQQKKAPKFENVASHVLEYTHVSNVVSKTRLNWDVEPSGILSERGGPFITNYIFDEYRAIRWEIVDTSKDSDIKKLVDSTRSFYGVVEKWYNVDIDLLLDKYHIRNDKNDKIIHLSKIIKDYCEKYCNLQQHDSSSLKQLFGISQFDRISNWKKASETLSKHKFQCSCGDFASKIVAMTMDFYSNCFYILLKNEKLYKIENTSVINVSSSGGKGKGNNNDIDSDWRVTSRVILRPSQHKKEAIWNWNRVSMCYDAIFQRLIVSDGDSVRLLYTF